MTMLYDSLACKFGGVKIMLFGRLVKSEVGKTWAMVHEVWVGKV